MELLGEDMSKYRQYLRQSVAIHGFIHQLPIAIHLAKQMINCVEYVHSKGLVHRDIKPANFVLREVDGQEFCYAIVDFGIAKQVEESSLFDSLLLD